TLPRCATFRFTNSRGCDRRLEIETAHWRHGFAEQRTRRRATSPDRPEPLAPLRVSAGELHPMRLTHAARLLAISVWATLSCACSGDESAGGAGAGGARASSTGIGGSIAGGAGRGDGGAH